MAKLQYLNSTNSIPTSYFVYKIEISLLLIPLLLYNSYKICQIMSPKSVIRPERGKDSTKEINRKLFYA